MEITTKGQKLDAEQWLSWRKEGKSTSEIAGMLNITPSMARIIARRFRAAGYVDPFYRKTKSAPPAQFDTATDTGAYILGILWGITSRPEQNYLLIRHKDYFFLQIVKEQLGLEPIIQKSSSHKGTQYRLKISRYHDIRYLEKLFILYGWTKRNDRERCYPAGSVNDKGFIRAWVELHSSADIHCSGRKRTPSPRLRVYGNQTLMAAMNEKISENTGLKPRTLQKTSNDITKGLYYAGKSFKIVFDWLYTNAEAFNPAVKDKMQDILSGRRTFSFATSMPFSPRSNSLIILNSRVSL